MWGNDDLALVVEIWFRSRELRTWVVKPSDPDRQPSLLFERSMEDSYNDPGSPVMKVTPQGTTVLLTADDGASLYLIGEGASPEGNRPFLDRLDLGTGETERLWRSEAPYYERPGQHWLMFLQAKYFHHRGYGCFRRIGALAGADGYFFFGWR